MTIDPTIANPTTTAPPPTENPTPTPTYLLLLHANVLLSSHPAILHTIRRLLALAAPAFLAAGGMVAPFPDPSDDEIIAAFAATPLVADILRILGHDMSQLPPAVCQDLFRWYTEIYASEGEQLQTLVEGVEGMLREMREKGVRVVVLCKKEAEGKQAGMREMVEGMLEKAGLRELVGLVVDAPVRNTGGVVEWFKRMVWEREWEVRKWIEGGEDIVMVEEDAGMEKAEEGAGVKEGEKREGKPEMQVVMASRGFYDLLVAQEIGAKACWVRDFEVSSAAELDEVQPDFVVENLEGLAEMLFAKEETNGPEAMELDGNNKDDSDKNDDEELLLMEEWIL